MTSNQLESEIESAAMKYAESRGWFQIKIMRASKRGFPDRFLARNGRVILVEFKSEKGKLSSSQIMRHAELGAHGIPVFVINNLTDARRILK